MPAYGTHYWSPTYCHAQGLAAQRWFGGVRVFTPAWCGVHPWALASGRIHGRRLGQSRLGSAHRRGDRSLDRLASRFPPYVYGDNVIYQNNNVYYGSQPVATQQEYYQQAVDIADSQSTSAAGGGAPKWLPLGVFGLIAEGQKSPT